MATRIYWIENFSNGARLGIMARPRAADWLDDEVLSLKKQKVGTLVSLLEPTEIKELGLEKESETCERHHIEFINFPIPDRGTPASDKHISSLIKVIIERIETGSSVIIHCRMGIGRSSIVAAAVLLLKGYTADQAICQITVVRGLKVPDTDEQVAWLRKREVPGSRA